MPQATLWPPVCCPDWCSVSQSGTSAHRVRGQIFSLGHWRARLPLWWQLQSSRCTRRCGLEQKAERDCRSGRLLQRALSGDREERKGKEILRHQGPYRPREVLPREAAPPTSQGQRPCSHSIPSFTQATAKGANRRAVMQDRLTASSGLGDLGLLGSCEHGT